MASGGARAGAGGTGYANRSDLNAGTQPVRAATNQPYGVAGQQQDAQQQIPLPDFGAPTARPGEPITHGMPTGPGPGPLAAGIPSAASSGDDVANQLRAIYSVYPSDDLADLIATLEP